MGNILIDINFKKLDHSIVHKPNGTKCILLPIESNYLIEKGDAIILNAIAYDLKNPTPYKTHLIKQFFDKEIYNSMPFGLRENMPIIGNLKA